jgi:hypothetical protein
MGTTFIRLINKVQKGLNDGSVVYDKVNKVYHFVKVNKK